MGQYGTYQITNFLCQGGFGKIFEARVVQYDNNDLLTEESTIVLKSQSSLTPDERSLMSTLCQKTRNMECTQTSLVYDHFEASVALEGQQKKTYSFYALQLLGQSLWDIKKTTRFSIPCIAQIGIEMIQQLEALHKEGYIHQDIKPDNILTTNRKNGLSLAGLSKEIYLVDFGNSERYVNDDGVRRPQQKLRQIVGRQDYMSAHALKFQTQSRRDDLESLIYTLIFLRSGKHLTVQQKNTMSNQSICQYGNLSSMKKVFDEIYKLKYDDEPDYSKIQFLFKIVLLD